MSGSEHHDFDMLADNVRDFLPTELFSSSTAAISAYNSADEEGKKKKIFASPTAKYTGWLREYKVGDEIKEKLEMTQIDMFAPLIRDSAKGGETELKICPVAIGMWVEDNTFTTPGGITHILINEYRLPSLECPQGTDQAVRRGIGSTDGGTEDATIQEYIMGEADVEKADKEDRLQVMFISGVPAPQEAWSIKRGDASNMIVFTDPHLKRTEGMALPSWSLALCPTEASHYLGELHQNGFIFNTKAKVCFKFLSKTIPDQTKTFLVHGKKYGCEKIEIQIDSNGISELMTGYFYEMTD